MEAESGLSLFDLTGKKGGEIVLTGGLLYGEGHDEFGGSVHILRGDALALAASGEMLFLSSGSS